MGWWRAPSSHDRRSTSRFQLCLLAISAFAVAGATIRATSPAAAIAGVQATQAAANTLTAQEQAAGWKLLFDGKSFDGWHTYQMDGVRPGWQVKDGLVVCANPRNAGDLCTNDEYEWFELKLEYNITPGGNSGIMYHVSEDYTAPYESGPEMQVLDDGGHADGKSRLTSAGSVFGLYPFPAGVVRPPGEWNDARIVVSGAHVEHWLNGTKIEYELWSPDWKAKVAASKFKQWPGYGMSRKGRIALQDHGDPVSYRTIRIRKQP